MQSVKSDLDIPYVSWSRPAQSISTQEDVFYRDGPGLPASTQDCMLSLKDFSLDPWDLYCNSGEGPKPGEREQEIGKLQPTHDPNAQDIIDKIIQQYLPSALPAHIPPREHQDLASTSHTRCDDHGIHEPEREARGEVNSAALGNASDIPSLAIPLQESTRGRDASAVNTTFFANYFPKLAAEKKRTSEPAELCTETSSALTPSESDLVDRARDTMSGQDPPPSSSAADEERADGGRAMVGGVGVGLLFRFRAPPDAAVPDGRAGIFVDYVFPAGPAHGRVLPGDVVEAVDGVRVGVGDMTEAVFRQVVPSLRTALFPGRLRPGDAQTAEWHGEVPPGGSLTAFRGTGAAFVGPSRLLRTG